MIKLSFNKKTLMSLEDISLKGKQGFQKSNKKNQVQFLQTWHTGTIFQLGVIFFCARKIINN